MNITTTARHFELDPEVRLFAVERLEKLGRFLSERDQTASEIHLVITAEKYRHEAELTLRVRGQDMIARELANEARTAVDLAADRLEHQLRRLKGRRLERQRGDRTRTVDGAAAADGDGQGDGVDGDTED